ncbi:phosphoribosyltransferase-like protein [Sordaria brevicollis]|uniref:adenine phosphoribosyltransferase n=1 Tax=Sordaria brevicollis TaxID=83679 RepID=A0AAE0NWL4_SORBR|nr:phosphoribosyltransferase-like protein [Sordaria brevicollis]
MSANANSAPKAAEFVTLTQDNNANTQSTVNQDASGRKSSSPAAAAAQLASTKVKLMAALRSFPDFPIPGINFIDILPLFQNVETHEALLVALQLQIELSHQKPDVIVGLDARGFLFGPSLALRMGASFVPVRKKGKMPGPCETAAYEKEYGTDFFQMQEGAIKPGQKVLIVDDIIATGGSAAAAGELVKKLGGETIGYLFILEIAFLKGREKLGGVPVTTLLETDE